MIKGAIFDFDGTLVDSMSIWDTVGEEYLRSLGIEPRESLRDVFKTFTLEESAEYYRTHYGVTLSVAEIVDGINGMIEDFYRNTVPLKKGVAEFLAGLSEHGVRMCVATVTDKYLAEAALIRLRVRQYFGEIITAVTVGCGKSEPGIYRAALAALGTEKRETLVFEDALHALMTAKNDGFPVAAVYDRYESRQEELRAVSDHYITSYQNFLKVFEDT